MKTVLLTLAIVTTLWGLRSVVYSEPAVSSPGRSPLTTSQLTKFKKETQRQVSDVLNLAGLDKLAPLPPYSNGLKQFRSKWQRIDAETAPFLGLWVQEWQLFPPYYSLAIFPSNVKGQVCIVEVQDLQFRDYAPPGEKIPPNPPPRFSIAKVSRGQGVGERVRFDRTLITRTRDVRNVEVEFLGVVTPQNEVQLYGSKAMPQLDPRWPANVLQQFKANQCQ